MEEEHTSSKLNKVLGIVAAGALGAAGVGTVLRREGDELPRQAPSPQYVYSQCMAAATTATTLAPGESIGFSFNAVTE